MQCSDCQAQLVDFHFQELPQTEHQAVCLHLCACAHCGAEYRSLHADLKGLQTSLLVAPRADLQDRVRAAALARPAQGPLAWLKRALTLPVPVYGVAAAAAALVLLLLWAWPRAGSGPHPAPRGGARTPSRAAVSEPAALPNPTLQYDARELIAVNPSLL